MPPRTTANSTDAAAASAATTAAQDDRRWVTVSWMPHASLSQTSHVAFAVRSILATLDPFIYGCSNSSTSSDDTQDHHFRHKEDWKVSVTIHGIAGLQLVPVAVMTPSAPLRPIKLVPPSNNNMMEDDDDVGQDYFTGTTVGTEFSTTTTTTKSWSPLVADATHTCQFDDHNNNNGRGGGLCLLNIPLRWRELPRDAYLKFQVTGPSDNLLYEATLPFFNAYGKLQTGMKKIPLSFPGQLEEEHRDSHRNPGLMPLPPGRNAGGKSSWQQDDDDPEWKASRILEQLDRFEEEASKSSNIATNATAAAAMGNNNNTSNMGVPPTTNSTATTTTTTKAYGDIPSVPWLDKMAREVCLQILKEGKEKSDRVIVGAAGSRRTENGQEPPEAYLIVELPTFDVPVIHEETFYPTPQQGPSGSVTPLDLALHRQQKAKAAATTTDSTRLSFEPPPFHPLDAIPFLDYEDENDSPIDDKYRTLAHDLLRGLVDPALKPDRVQRDKLAAIIASPSHHPSREEKDLLWRFRFSLVDNRRALTKFLLAVDWTVESEVVQAAELLEQWRKRSPIEVTDALKLLGKQVAYQTNLVRAYAIDTLASAPDEELSLYLLQLVQALKFENVQEAGTLGTSSASNGTTKKSSLATFLIGRAARNVELATYLYWYLKVELQDPAHGARYREIFAEFQQTLSQTQFPSKLMPSSKSHYYLTTGSLASRSTSGDGSTVAPTTEPGKISDSIASITPFNKLVESVSKFGDKLMGADAHASDSAESSKMKSKSKKNRSVWDVLSDQDLFISGIMDIQLSYATKARQPAKEAHLRSVLAKEGFERNPNSLPFPLPCAPQIMVNGVQPQKAKVFKSAVYPALLEFNVEHVVDKNDFVQSKSSSQRVRHGHNGPSATTTSDGTRHDLKSYRVILKTGDDLRQDQLAMMMIKLMDGLLKRASLDLGITPYSVIATSHSSGMIEFVEQSSPISQILSNNNNSILQFLQSCAPQKGGKYDIRPNVLSNYVRSVAGESVITYLLGIGDRHLDNLMITRNGHFFHIDFGFMFGRDPKPFPPAFRLTREMVEGMGGMESTEYRQFCSLACQAFNALRKSAGLVLNLLHLMSDAGIEDLSNNPSADADGVIAKVEERFRLDLTDEQAEIFFLNLINDTLAAWAPKVTDWVHSIAVARR